MAKFVFELESLLAQRRRVERERQRALASLERERRRLLDQAVALQRSMVVGRGMLRGSLAAAEKIDVTAVRMQAHGALLALIDLQRVALQAAGTQQKAEGARLSLLKAAVQRKAVETLRSQRLEAWRRDEARRETAEADDIILMRAGRGAEAGLESGDL
ncbi:hypothetical protein BH11PLA1_BH11PLA1_08970 [soil metagenome]